MIYQRVDSVHQTIETPWIYVEQWGWAQDRTWFARNVRRGPLTDGRRRRATQEEPGANETEAAVEAQAQNNTELLLPVHELEEIAFAQDDEGDSSSSSGSR